jgi:hypothetical protein
MSRLISSLLTAYTWVGKQYAYAYLTMSIAQYWGTNTNHKGDIGISNGIPVSKNMNKQA